MSQSLLTYPAISDPGNVTPIDIDTNGDGIDELAFIRTNYYTGASEIVVFHGSPAYNTILHSGTVAYPVINDPQNVTPLAIDTNGDGIDELAFVRTNYRGSSEIVVLHGSPAYTTILHSGSVAYPDIDDPENVTPLAIDTNGDKIDELAFVRTNYYTGATEIVVLHGSPAYTTILHAGTVAYPNIDDPENVTPLAIDTNGDGIDELAFVRTNYPGATEIVVLHGSPAYTTILHAGTVAYPNIDDPENVTPLAIQAY